MFLGIEAGGVSAVECFCDFDTLDIGTLARCAGLRLSMLSIGAGAGVTRPAGDATEEGTMNSSRFMASTDASADWSTEFRSCWEIPLGPDGALKVTVLRLALLQD